MQYAHVHHHLFGILRLSPLRFRILFFDFWRLPITSEYLTYFLLPSTPPMRRKFLQIKSKSKQFNSKYICNDALLRISLLQTSSDIENYRTGLILKATLWYFHDNKWIPQLVIAVNRTAYRILIRVNFQCSDLMQNFCVGRFKSGFTRVHAMQIL